MYEQWWFIYDICFCRRRFKRFTKWGKRKGRHGDGQIALDDDAISIPAGGDQQHTVKVSEPHDRK